MFRTTQGSSGGQGAFALAEVIYHSAVRSVRKSHGNALVGLFMNIFQTVLLVVVFYLMFSLLNLRETAIRGDFLLYIMSGIFLFMCHIKTVGAVLSTDGLGAPIMKHAPMNILVSIAAAALGALYIQMLSLLAVVAVYHLAVTPVVIDRPAGAMGMVLAAWFSGAGVGMVFLALKVWIPDVVQVAAQIYMRANMIASGKMFVANLLPTYLLPLFDWNPLFHAIDQARGFIFINYQPMHTSPGYPFWVGLACVGLGLMGAYYTRQRASISWQAKR